MGKIKFEASGLPLPNTNRVDPIGNDCKLNLRLFSFYFYWWDTGREGVFHSEIEMDCKNYYWGFLGLWEGLELGSEG